MNEDTENITTKDKKTLFLEKHISKYNKVINFIDKEVDRRCRNKESGSRVFVRVKNMIVNMKKDVPKIVRVIRTRSSGSKKLPKTNGLTILHPISAELANFLQVKKGTMLSRIDICRAIGVYIYIAEDEDREWILDWKYLNEESRDLRNGKTILPDKTLSKLLKYEQYKKDVKAGKINRTVTNKETGLKSIITQTDDSFYRHLIPKLIGIHINK